MSLLSWIQQNVSALQAARAAAMSATSTGSPSSSRPSTPSRVESPTRSPIPHAVHRASYAGVASWSSVPSAALVHRNSSGAVFHTRGRNRSKSDGNPSEVENLSSDVACIANSRSKPQTRRRELKRKPILQHAATADFLSRVQEADGGFFESFSALSWKRENRRLQAIREEEAKKGVPPPSESSVGIETPVYEISRKEWQQLYITVLYTIQNQIGSRPSERLPVVRDLYRHAQKAFGVSDEEHERFLVIAQKEQPPILVLNVTVLEAKDLEAKDPNGFSDPFCMLGIQPRACANSSNYQPSNVDSVDQDGGGCSSGGENPDDEYKLKKHHSSDEEEEEEESEIGSGFEVVESSALSSLSYYASYLPSSMTLLWKNPVALMFLSSFKLSFKRRDREAKKEQHRDSLSNDIPAKYISATSVKPHTLNPQWDEKFTFDIDDVNTDKLHLDIWDNDDESSVFEAVRQLNQVQSWKGLGRYFKQVAQSARSHGTYSVDDFLGCLNVTVHDIPSTGVDRWYELQGRSQRSNVQGQIRLRLSLTTRDRESPSQDHWWEVREHEQMLHTFIDYEMNMLEPDVYKWNGDLCRPANVILHQHAIQGDLSELQQAVCHWRAYSHKHMEQSFDYTFLYKLLQRLNVAWNTDSLTRDEEQVLSESFSQFVEFCFLLLRKQRDLFPPANKPAYYKLEYLLRCLALINEMQAFWRCCPFHKELHLEITNAVKKGTSEWYETMYALTRPQIKTDDSQLHSFIDLINVINVDLHRCLVFCNKLFETFMGVNYFLVSYKQLDKMLFEHLKKDWIWKVEDDMKMTVEKLCIKLRESADISSEAMTEDLTVGTSMFELYLTLQEFSRFKDQLPANDRRSLAVASFHEWFSGALLRWLSIARYKAMLRIRKAVELDKADQVDAGVKLSTSAVDTTACFYQIKDFWKQLAWSDLVTAYAFVLKILDDICNGATYYGELVHQKLREVGYFDEEGQFDVTEQLCLTINNIEHVRKSLKALPEELGFQGIVRAIEKAEGDAYGQQCRNSLNSMLQSAEDDVANKIIHVVRRVSEKMRPDLKKYVFHLAWAPDALPADDAIVPLMQYLDSNLTTLNHNLLRSNFERILDVIWHVVLEEMWAQAASGVGEKQPVFFERLYEACNILVEFFHADHKGLSLKKIHCKTYQDLCNMLTLHKSETNALIRRYFLEKLIDQQKTEIRDFGTLTVRVYFHHDCLFIEVLHARDIIALDPNGFSDPFVIIELQPQHIFPDSPHLQTKVQKKTLHPLFDECFEYSVTLEQCKQEAAVVLFTVMDHDFMLSNDFAGEAYLSLNTIPGVSTQMSASDITILKATELILLRSKYKENAILTTLERRVWDKSSQEFAKNRKTRMI